MKDAVGPYRIVRSLGEGGMGIVYEATDARLGRRVALKTLRGAAGDPTARERLRREARAGASVSHPNVCQVYDVLDDDGEVFVAMELLEGEPLSARIERGPLPAREALEISLGILGALEALHARGIVHRDLKPSNVFLTPHGVKILDFGLASPPASEAGAIERRLTTSETILGTPQYMAPERWGLGEVGPPSDLFALGAILFEMLTGRPAFSGRTLIEIGHAVTSEQSPTLSGSGGIEAIDRILQRALAKDPKDRHESAGAMALEVRRALLLVDDTAAPEVHTLTRIQVLPFRLLRPDPEIEFLSVGLPDAVTASLSEVPSLVVRGTQAGARFAASDPDLKRIATETGVDLVLVGTLLRAGERVRVTAQLVEVPEGTLVWSETSQVSTGDVFELQDTLARKIVESLALPLSARDKDAVRRDVPRTARAYELYLRANQIGATTELLHAARDTYLACLAEDPSYAPAWARIGRVHRVMAKYGMCEAAEGVASAEEAFRRAFELNPDLSIAHNLFTYFEVEERGAARSAMERLVRRARSRPADPELFAGLVLACRFAGLLDASLAADRRARRIDPGVRTSVAFTYWMRGEYGRAMEHEDQDVRWLLLWSQPMLGRDDEAIAEARRMEARNPSGNQTLLVTSTRAALERRADECADATRRILASGFHDPEGLYFAARNLARTGAVDASIDVLERVVTGGFHAYAAFVRDPWLDPLRTAPRFVALMKRVDESVRESRRVFVEAGGDLLLGVTA